MNKKTLRRNKKGSAVDYIYAIPLFFILAISLLIGIALWNMFSTSSLTNYPESQAKIDDFNQHGRWTFDFIGVMFFVAFFGVPIFLALFARHHPAFVFITILVLLVMIVISPGLSNGYMTIVGTPGIAETASQLNVTNTIMDYLPQLTIVYSIFLLLAMFAFKSGATAI